MHQFVLLCTFMYFFASNEISKSFLCNMHNFMICWQISASARVYRNQLGRRNLTEPQKMIIIADQYEAQKKTISNKRGINQHTAEVDRQSEGQPKKSRGTAGEIAKHRARPTAFGAISIRKW